MVLFYTNVVSTRLVLTCFLIMNKFWFDLFQRLILSGCLPFVGKKFTAMKNFVFLPGSTYTQK